MMRIRNLQKSKKIIGILIILSFLIIFLTPIDFSKLGTRKANNSSFSSINYHIAEINYTDGVDWEDPPDPPPNFFAISESNLPTRWILQNATLTPVENFTDDISGSNWDLYGVSERIMYISSNPSGDSYVRMNKPNTNYGTLTSVYVSYVSGGYTDENTFLEYEFPYFDLNVTSNSSLYYYGSANSNGYVYVYHTTDFDESTITWNNQPTSGVYQTG